MLVEQNASRRTALARLLEATGRYCPVVAPDGRCLTETELGSVEMALLSTDIRRSIHRISTTFSSRGKTTIPIVILSDPVEMDQMEGTIEHCVHFAILQKPVAGRDLLARMRSVISEHRYRYETPFELGDVEIIPAKMRIVHRDGRSHSMTNMQLRLLAGLLKARGMPMSRQDLLTDVWGYAPNTSTSTIDTHIYQLRQKIEMDPAHPTVIIYRDGGYSIRAPQERTLQHG
ncbi:MAG: winged helix-turn-helix domain-containing protein [Rhodobacteraceae bacterium]|nr:winged helix-turn-helix domain-containing protein [Paracoccaceae bacterium]